MVMERLREISHVAYVRFASHYKNFLSLEELQAEFERLATTPKRPVRRAGAAQPPLLPPTEMSRVQEQGRKQETGSGKQEEKGQEAEAAEGVVTSITERRRRAGGAR
jgi:hypothetical protein